MFIFSFISLGDILAKVLLRGMSEILICILVVIPVWSWEEVTVTFTYFATILDPIQHFSVASSPFLRSIHLAFEIDVWPLLWS